MRNLPSFVEQVTRLDMSNGSAAKANSYPRCFDLAKGRNKVCGMLANQELGMHAEAAAIRTKRSLSSTDLLYGIPTRVLLT